ncbi:MAG: flagellar hook assembly protein FlgD [Betaproteobacteria bacterium]|nr:flagellar hook assembly protein FlgD [Betaproteobacteria bacterium]
MSTISSAAPIYPINADTTAGGGSAAGKTDASSDVANRFLTLLVTQLQNQDPLNPLDNAQVTSQLAQLSTVNGINKLNDTLSGLAASFGANQYLQAAGLVGHDVLVPGNSMSLAAGKAAGGFTLPSGTDKVTVTITDGAGQRVRQLDLGKLPAGAQRFEWDGKTDAGVAVKDGSYGISITGTIDGKAVTLDALASGRVTGIVPGSNGTQVQVAGLGLVDLASVKQIN